jgi:hypothetical protein
MTWCRTAPLFLVPLAVVPVRARAQEFTFTPQIGLYVPTENLAELTNGGAYRLDAGPSFGARFGLRFGSRIAVDVSGNYVPTTLSLPEGSTDSDKEAKLFTGAAQLVVFLLPNTSPVAVYLNGGLGLVGRSGEAFTNASDKSDLAGVFGAGAAIRLGGLALHLGADLYSYSATVTGVGFTSDSFKQLDFQIKLGLGIPFGPFTLDENTSGYRSANSP